MERSDRPRRTWQNLLYRKCPNCSHELSENPTHEYLVCYLPSVEQPERYCFFLKKSTAVTMLHDQNHPAYFNLNPYEVEKIEAFITSLNIT